LLRVLDQMRKLEMMAGDQWLKRYRDAGKGIN
jgi:hypothetical protein